jgi:hypothetical protein
MIKVRLLVETSYGFGALPESVSDNAARAQHLLSNNAFIYRVRPDLSSLPFTAR